jgi:hypothetical protein
MIDGSRENAMSSVARLAWSVALGLVAVVPIHAIDVPLTSYQQQRALLLSRWPTSDQARAQFHARYIFPVTATANFFTVDQIEIITEFRRLELIGEDHEKLNELFARAGLEEAEDALRPYHNQLTIAARLYLGPTAAVLDVPVPDIELDNPRLSPFGVRTLSTTYSGKVLTGGTVAAIFDAQAVGETTRPVVIKWQGTELARVPVDFRQLE